MFFLLVGVLKTCFIYTNLLKQQTDPMAYQSTKSKAKVGSHYELLCGCIMFKELPNKIQLNLSCTLLVFVSQRLTLCQYIKKPSTMLETGLD